MVLHWRWGDAHQVRFIYSPTLKTPMAFGVVSIASPPGRWRPQDLTGHPWTGRDCWHDYGVETWRKRGRGLTRPVSVYLRLRRTRRVGIPTHAFNNFRVRPSHDDSPDRGRRCPDYLRHIERWRANSSTVRFKGPQSASPGGSGERATWPLRRIRNRMRFQYHDSARCCQRHRTFAADHQVSAWPK
jgi:hypothetical protein